MIKKFALSLVLIGLFASIASANLIIDLRVHGAVDPHNVTVDAGATAPIQLDIWATIEGAAGNSSLTDAYMRFTSVENASAGLQGNMSNPTLLSPFATLGNLGTSQNYDANPDLEWGGTYPVNSAATYYFALTTTPPVGNSFQLGTLLWTPTTALAGGVDVLQAIPYVRQSNQTGFYSFMQDGITYTNGAITANPGIVSGTPVTLTVAAIPEPTTLILLGMGLVSLLLIRRRK